MAYNQEYPNYLDAQLYNNDWLLYKVKKNEGDISDLKTKTAENEAKISALDTRVETNATAIAELKTETTANSSSIASLVTVTTSNTDRIEALEQGGGGGDPALEGRVKTLEDDMADVQADVTAINTAVTQVQTKQDTQETEITSLQSSFSAMSTTLSSFSTTLTAHTDQLTALESEVSGLTEKRIQLYGASSSTQNEPVTIEVDTRLYKEIIVNARISGDSGFQEFSFFPIANDSNWTWTFTAAYPQPLEGSPLRVLSKRITSSNNALTIDPTYEELISAGRTSKQASLLSVYYIYGIAR